MPHMHFVRTTDDFMRYVEKRADGCWIWTRSCDPAGYGRCWYQRRGLRAHQVAWLLFRGPIPKRRPLITHSCDVTSCVNPDHLCPGTSQSNHDEMIMRNRERYRQELGEKNPSARLTDADVRRIRKAVAQGTSRRALAVQYGISVSNISYLVRRLTWSHVE